MIGVRVLLALIAVLAGVVGYLMTGNTVLLVVAAIGLITAVSSYVLTLGG